jgi:hypothetical protein
MDIQAGDWVMTRPTDGNESLFQKGILLFSKHTHDELVGVNGGKLVVGNATTPHFTLTPVHEMIRECEEGKKVMGIYRWHEFVEKPNKAKMKKFKDGVTHSLRLLERLRIPYDKKAILSHARNYVRSYVPFLPSSVSRHRESKVFCTESCFLLYDFLGINLYELIGHQDLVAPCHAEKLVRDGYLMPVEDYGLKAYLEKK